MAGPLAFTEQRLMTIASNGFCHGSKRSGPIHPAEQIHEGNCQKTTGDVHLRYVSEK